MSESPKDDNLCPDGVFATTHWSVVLSAGGSSDQAMAALERLCRGYWYPLYAHIRRRGYPPEEAEDLTQEFFASLLRHESLAAIRKEKGRFRTFLLSSLNYFLSDAADKRRAAKRGAAKSSLNGMPWRRKNGTPWSRAPKKHPIASSIGAGRWL